MSALTKRRRMPAEVPVLTSGNFCRNKLVDGKGRCCMVGWAAVVFLGMSDREQDTTDEYDIWEGLPVSVRLALLKTSPTIKKTEAEDRDSEVAMGVADPDGCNAVTCDNDLKKHSRYLLAKWWSRAMALLGYTEGNPEA